MQSGRRFSLFSHSLVSFCFHSFKLKTRTVAEDACTPDLTFLARQLGAKDVTKDGAQRIYRHPSSETKVTEPSCQFAHSLALSYVLTLACMSEC